MPDPDGIGLQLIATPGGPGPTAVPGGRLVEVEPLVRPVGMDNIVLKVADLRRSAEFYSHFFPQAEAARRRANSRSRLPIRSSCSRPARAMKLPGVASYAVRVSQIRSREGIEGAGGPGGLGARARAPRESCASAIRMGWRWS